MMSKLTFWFEIFIMAIIPLPLAADSWANNAVFYIDTTNFIDPLGNNGAPCEEFDICNEGDTGPPGSGTVQTPYYASDFLLAMMLLRFYFVA